jgi:hypothetical protein
MLEAIMTNACSTMSRYYEASWPKASGEIKIEIQIDPQRVADLRRWKRGKLPRMGKTEA